LTILYRGPLASCNYRCEYCPFDKRRDSKRELRVDWECLERFVGWIAERRNYPVAVLFTPRGEALIRPWYRQAMIHLSRLSHVRRAVAQTNLSCSVDWLGRADPSRIALWCTYHPGEVARSIFVNKCTALSELGVRYSVGVVGRRDYIGEIETLRAELPEDVYLWVNAFQQSGDYYLNAELERLTTIDPLLSYNVRPHESLGEYCRTGETVIFVDGSGDIRRCYFIDELIGNLYDPQFEQFLHRRRCTNATCQCHIGYVHLEKLGLYDVFGPNVLERIPTGECDSCPTRTLTAPSASQKQRCHVHATSRK